MLYFKVYTAYILASILLLLVTKTPNFWYSVIGVALWSGAGTGMFWLMNLGGV